MDEDLKEYRKGIIETQIKLTESFDKLIITLSGGALGLSITFLKDIVGSDKIFQPQILLLAWGLLVLSITAILGEILFGIRAYKETVKQIDDGSVYDKKAKSKFSSLSVLLHWVSAISLVIGLLCISYFSFQNIGV